MRPSSDSSTNSDRMSGQLNDVILLLHAPDGSRWSTFMASRLDSPPYEIRSISKDLTILEGPPEDEDGENDADNKDAENKTKNSRGKNDDEEEEDEDEEEGEVYFNTFDVTNAVVKRNLSDGNNNYDSNTNSRTQTRTSRDTDSDGTIKGSTCSSADTMQGEEDSNPPPVAEKTRGAAAAVAATRTGSSASVVTLTDASSVEDCLLYSRACIVFLSPDILEGDKPFPIEISGLNHRSTVFLFLGVDIQEVRNYFGAQSDLVFRCRCCHIDGSQVSICDALLQVVQAYEDPGGSGSLSSSDVQDLEAEEAKEASGGCEYLSPSSVQLNRVERVFPRELTGEDRLVYVLLEQSPEHEVVVEVGPSKDEFPLTNVCDRLYSFTVPDGLSGKVSFVVGSQGHEIGSESVRLLTKLDQLQEILSEECAPVTLLARAVGAAPDDEGGLDTALAFRLQQLAPAQTFAAMFPVENGLNSAGDKATAKHVQYPSLLHLAADYNLRTFCHELLRYPGMTGAARTENKDGETPLQIAARKRFTQLHTDLAQFAKRHGGSSPGGEPEPTKAAEDLNEDLYVEPSLTRSPPPPAHRPSKAAGYVNSGIESYITMNDLQPEKSDLLHARHQMSTGGREFPGTTNFRNDIDDDDSPIDYQNLETFRLDASNRRGSDRSSTRERLGSTSPTSPGDDSPRTSARKALKVMGVTEEEVKRSHSPSLLLESKSRSFDSDDYSHNRLFTNSTPRSVSNRSNPESIISSSSRTSFSSNLSIDQFDSNEEISQHKSSKGGKMNKFKSLLSFGKTKGKRSSSISEVETAQIKAATLQHTTGRSSARRGSESGVSSNVTSQNRMKEAQEERDSGSYSDEEKEKVDIPIPRRSGKNKAFKERDHAMSRRLSRRAQAAVNEKIDTAPTLPSRAGRRRGAFKSFVDE